MVFKFELINSFLLVARFIQIIIIRIERATLIILVELTVIIHLNIEILLFAKVGFVRQCLFIFVVLLLEHFHVLFYFDDEGVRQCYVARYLDILRKYVFVELLQQLVLRLKLLLFLHLSHQLFQRAQFLFGENVAQDLLLLLFW